MASTWIRTAEIGSGTDDDPYRPDLKGYDVDGWSGNKSHPNGAPIFVCRVYADTTTLSNLTSEAGVTELPDPTDTLDQMFGQSRTASEWDDGFSVE